MAIERAETLLLSNGTTVDTGTGIDIRLLTATAVASDTTQSVRWTHTQDGTNRTFDPANALVTTVSDPLTLQMEGWALRLSDDMTPVDDTNCNAVLTAGTATVTVDASLNMNGGTNTGGTNTIAIKVSLWRYNISSDTGTLIATGTTNQTWNTSVIGGENNTFKETNVSIVVGSAVEFSPGEVLMAQFGATGTTLVDATLGTTNYDLTLRIGAATDTRIVWESEQSIKQVCVLTSNNVGEGTPTRTLVVGQPRNVVGEGTTTFAKVVIASKTFNLIGEALITHNKTVDKPFSLIGDGVSTMTRVVVASKSFNIFGEGIPTGSLSIALTKTLLGDGLTSFAKVTTAAKTFNLIGDGLPTESRNVLAIRTFNLVGDGVPTRQFLVNRAFNLIGDGLPDYIKAVTASKAFTLIGDGVLTRQFSIDREFNLIGDGVPTMTKLVVASKTFDLIGDGVATHNKLVGMTYSLVGDGVPTFSRIVTASKTFNLIGDGVSTREALNLVFERNLIGESTIDFVKFTTVYRFFDLIGRGKIETSGDNQSTITIPIDEVPTGGGDTIIVKKVLLNIFDD